MIKKDSHCTIITIPDKLWDENKAILRTENHPRLWWTNYTIQEKVLDGILYILRTGCQWKMLPSEYGSGSTCHRRFQEWNKLDVFKRTWVRLLKSYDDVVGINWALQSIDSTSIKSPWGRYRKQSHRQKQTGHKKTHSDRQERYSAVCSYFFSNHP